VRSAEAFAQAFLGPGCSAAVNAGASRRKLRRLFRDVPDAEDRATGCGPPSAEELRARLGLDAGGGAAWLQVYRRQLLLLQQRLSCCAESACAPDPGQGTCTLLGLPWALAPNVTWRAVGGPLGVASAFAEIFEMQFCEGLEAGWGLSEEEVVELLSLLEVPFNQAGANEASARNLGSELMHDLLQALSPASPDGAPAVVLYFGHDTNLQFLRRMFDLNWLSQGWWPNVVEPGAQLVFEVYDGGLNVADGGAAVRILKVAATPQQQRTASPLNASAPPSAVPLWVPGCGDVFCPLPRLLSIGWAAVRRSCVEPLAANATAGASATAAPVPGRSGAQAPAPPAQASPSGPRAGPVLLAGAAAAAFLGWRYSRRTRAAARGYEVLGSRIGAPGFSL